MPIDLAKLLIIITGHDLYISAIYYKVSPVDCRVRQPSDNLKHRVTNNEFEHCEFMFTLLLAIEVVLIQ